MWFFEWDTHFDLLSVIVNGLLFRCDELFDGENIVTGKTDYGQGQLLSGPFATNKNEK